MLVEVRPLPAKRWHGHEGANSITSPKVIEVLYSPDEGKYMTGLTEEEATSYGKVLGVDLSDRYEFEKSHPFWGSKAGQIKLENSTMIFDTSKPQDFVKIKNMKASKHVANSMREWENGDWQEATHVIFDEEEDIEIKASKIDKKREANLIVASLSTEAKRQMVLLLSSKSVQKRSDQFINVELDAVVEEKTEEFLRLFKMGKEEVYIRANVLDMINRGIINKEANGIYYMGEQLGFDFEDTVTWFKTTTNVKMKSAMLDQLNKKN